MLGLGTGAIYAAIAVGLVLVYQGSGVINLAQGAMAMYSVYVFAELRGSGDLVIPIPGLPRQIHLADQVAFAPAMALALGSAAVLGLAVHLLVFRPLRSAPAVSKVVASVGVMIVLQSVVVLRFGTSVRSMASILPSEGLDLLGTRVPRDRLYLAALVVALTVVLSLVYHGTRFGLATRAAAENEKGATLLGYSPDLLSATNWVLASVVAGGVGILVAPITGLDTVKFTLLVVPALGAALVGRFASFGWAATAALALGVVQSQITKLQTEVDWLPRSGIKEGIPFLVIIVALYLGGKSLPTRGTLSETQLPVAPSARRVGLPAVAGAAIGAAALLTLEGSYRFGLITSLIAAVMCLSLVVLTGYVGQISVAQMAFAGVAGFSLSRLTQSTGIPFPIAPLLAALLATAAGLLVAIPALRVRGVHLAVVTLAAGVALEELAFKNPDLTGGFDGSPVADPSLFGVGLGIRSATDFPRPAFGLLVLSVLVALSVVVANLRRGAGGRRMLAVRSDERAAASVGISVTRTKLAAFTLSAFLAGVTGVLIGYQRTQLSASSFGIFVSLSVLAMAYLGGITSVSGALIGGLLSSGGIVFVVADRSGGLGRYELLFNGVALIAAAILFPGGVAGLLGRARRSRPREPLAPPDGTPPAPAPAPRPTPVLSPSPRLEAVASAGTPLLEVTDAAVSFSGIRAVHDVSLTITAGRFVGLIGPNGAGKTTFVDALTGFVPLHTGRIRFGGHDLTAASPSERVRHGMARTFQSIQLFEDLSVRENVLVAAERPRWWGLAVECVVPRRAAEPAATRALELLDIADLGDQMPSELSQGQRQLVGVARAIATGPRLLLLDEPAAGLDSRESADLGGRLRGLLDAGLTILMIDHDMSLVMSVCDELHVLDTGTLLASGTPGEIRHDPRVLAAYLGETGSAGDTVLTPEASR